MSVPKLICFACCPAVVLFRTVEEIMNGMDLHGWAGMPGCGGAGGSLRLRKECEEACENGDFRRDQVMWLQPGDGGGSNCGSRWGEKTGEFVLIEPRMGTLVRLSR
jgi:hypothetical protein